MVVIEGSKVKNPESIFGNGWEAYFYKEGHVYKNEATGPDLFCRYNYYELETLEELENAYKIYYRIGTEIETTIPDDVKKYIKMHMKVLEKDYAVKQLKDIKIIN